MRTSDGQTLPWSGTLFLPLPPNWIGPAQHADIVEDRRKLSLAETAIESAAFYEQRLRNSLKDQAVLSALSTDYLVLRIALASSPSEQSRLSTR